MIPVVPAFASCTPNMQANATSEPTAVPSDPDVVQGAAKTTFLPCAPSESQCAPSEMPVWVAKSSQAISAIDAANVAHMRATGQCLLSETPVPSALLTAKSRHLEVLEYLSSPHIVSSLFVAALDAVKLSVDKSVVHWRSRFASVIAPSSRTRRRSAHC